MITIDTEQLNRPIKDLRLLTARFEDGVIIECQMLEEYVDSWRQVMEKMYYEPGVANSGVPLSFVTVARPKGFRRVLETTPPSCENDPDATTAALCWYGESEKDENGEEGMRCLWASPIQQRRWTQASEEEFQSTQTDAPRY